MTEVPRRTGEGAESQNPDEVLQNLFEQYKGDKFATLDNAAREIVTRHGRSYKRMEFVGGKYNDLLPEIQQKLNEVSMLPPRQPERGGPTPPRQPERGSSTPPPTEARGRGESGGDNRGASSNTAKKIAVVAGLTASALAVGGIGYAIGHNNSAKAEEGGRPSANIENDNVTDDSEAVEAMEEAESIDVSDQYAGHFANDDGNGYNERKSGRYSFGESLENADYETIMKEEEHIAYHEPSLFAAQYYDLDDDAKLVLRYEDGTEVDTANMTMNELDALMDSNESAHRQMASHYLGIIRQGQHEMTTLNGTYINVFGRANAENGAQFTSRNIEPVHCSTNENGSQAIEFKYTIPGTDRIAKTTWRLGCGLQVVRAKDDPGAERIITTTSEIPENPAVVVEEKKPDENPEITPDSQGEEVNKEKTALTEEQVFGGGAGNEYETDTTGPGSIGEAPSTSSTTENMGGDGNTSIRAERPEEAEPVTAEQRQAERPADNIQSEAPEVAEARDEGDRVQEQIDQNTATYNEAVEAQPSGGETIAEHTDDAGNVNLDELLDM